jgi:hypothetical protein
MFVASGEGLGPGKRFNDASQEALRFSVVTTGLTAWSCPHCAVENFSANDHTPDMVECDYCGRVFAVLG